VPRVYVASYILLLIGITYDDALVPTGHDYNGVWDVGDVLEELVC